jgi:maleylacetate reductase
MAASMTDQPFVYTANPGRVLFGFGTREKAAEEARLLGAGQVLVLTTPHQAKLGDEMLDRLGRLGSGLFSEAAMHTPVSVTEKALAHLQETGADCLLAAGGGSTTGLAKALALRTGLPQIALPTTYAGSEMTPILGQTENGVKTTQRTLKVLPQTVIYDVELTMGLPAGLTLTSGINAMAHAVEALYAENRNPIIDQMSETGIKALFAALPVLQDKPQDREARWQALYGAWMCGVALGSVGMALHHKICHTLGGSFDLPHAETHTVMLAHTAAFNAPAARQLDRLGELLAGQPMGEAIFDLVAACGGPTSLAGLGLTEADLDKAADLAVANPYFNPRPFNRADIRALLQQAYAGQRPQTGARQGG